MSQDTTPPAESPEVPQLPEEQLHEAPYVRRLERIEEGKWIAGVATGLAEYFAVPTWLIRVIFLFLLAPAGVGVLTYLVLVVFMPHESEDESPAERWFGRIDNPERAMGIGLAVIAFFVLLGSMTHADPGVLVGLGLLAVGVLLYQGGILGNGGGSTPSDPDEGADEGADTGSSGRPPRPPREPRARQAREPRPPKAPRPRREKSNLGAYTFSATLIVLGLLASADIGALLDPKAFHYVAVALSVIGLGLVVGAWRGRSRGLILLGLATLPFLGITWITGNVDTIVEEWKLIAASEDIHEDEHHFIEQVDGTETIDFGVGQVTVDLTDTEFESSASVLNITMDAGQLTVIVPDDVRVYAHTDLGQIELPGPDADGIDVSRTYGPSTDDADGIVDIHLDVGQLVIQEGN